jgi:RNA polymerase sigma-70 factor (ECF subfamily)
MRDGPIHKNEEAVVAAARSGDEGAFEQLIVKHRPSLRAHSYRMLGSQDEAEDALQEGLIRAWRGISRFEGRSSVRTWLHSIVTNASLDLIARRRRRTLAAKFRLPADPADWVTDRPWNDDVRAQPDPDQLLGPEASRASPEARYEQREALELAFVAALQHLPARQRAVLILRDVLSFTAREVAAALDSSPAAVNSALQRARATVAHLSHEGGGQATRRSARDGRLDDTAERFVDAFLRDDPEAIIALLAENRSIPETLRTLAGQPGSPG